MRALDSRVSLLQTGHLGIFFIKNFYAASEDEISTMWSQNLGECHVKN